MEAKNFNLSWEILWKLFFMVLLGWVLFLARDVVAALFLAIVISTAFDPIVSYLESKKIPRVIGTLAIYLVAIFIIGLIIYAFVPIALSEFSNLIKYTSKIFGTTPETFQLQGFVATLNSDLQKLTDLLFSGSVSLVDIATKFLGGVISAVSVLAISFYLTLGRGGVGKFFLAILPSVYETKVIHLYARVERKISRWLTGQLFLSLVVGVAIFLGLWILGVKYSFLLGLLGGLLELVPYVGPILTGSLAVLVGLDQSVSMGLYVLILFIVILQLENHLLVPLVNRYTTALNPAVILTALLIGGKVFGIIGIILAVPISVLFQEILEDWAEAKHSRRGLGL